MPLFPFPPETRFADNYLKPTANKLKPVKHVKKVSSIPSGIVSELVGGERVHF